MIICGGENIYPRELEEFFFTHPAVADVQIIGVPCEKYGEEIVARIEFHPGHSATEQELQTWCKERIAHFKTPRYFKFVEELRNKPEQGLPAMNDDAVSLLDQGVPIAGKS